MKEEAIELRVITIEVQIFGPSLVQLYKIFSECTSCDYVKCQTHKRAARDISESG